MIRSFTSGTITVFWSEEDQEYVGIDSRYPSLSWLNPDPAQAFLGIYNLVEDIRAGVA